MRRKNTASKDSPLYYDMIVAYLRQDKLAARKRLRDAFATPAPMKSGEDFVHATDTRFAAMARELPLLIGENGYLDKVPLPAPLVVDGVQMYALTCESSNAWRRHPLESNAFENMPAVGELFGMATQAKHGLQMQLSGPGALCLDLYQLGDTEMLSLASLGSPAIYSEVSVYIPPLNMAQAAPARAPYLRLVKGRAVR
jgi:hypothetical protein